MPGAVPGRVCHVCSLLHRTHRLVKQRISNSHKIIIVEREAILWKYLTVDLDKQIRGGVGALSGEIWLSLGRDQRNALRKAALGRKGVP